MHAQLLAFGTPCPVSDLFGRRGRELLGRLQLPEPWRSNVLVSVAMIDDLELMIAAIERELKDLGADHRYVPLLTTIEGRGRNARRCSTDSGESQSAHKHQTRSIASAVPSADSKSAELA